MTSKCLRITIVLGSVRQGPPKPVRLGSRVTEMCVHQLTKRGHNVTVVDPLEFNVMQHTQPCFTFNKPPEELEKLNTIFKASDAYVAVSPEYNHSISPALAHTFNLFGSSIFSYKPSAIVTYSAGQWGGTRAATGLRPFLSELGCLPVSSMIHIPSAQKTLLSDGSIRENSKENEWESYCARTWNQLEWWGNAASTYKLEHNPFEKSAAFISNPEERNAP